MSKENPEKLILPSLADIQKNLKAKKDGELVELPSGLVFRLTKPSISRLLKDDVFPAELIATAIKMDSNTNQPTSKDDYLKSLKIIDEVVYRATVFPKTARTQEEMTDESILIEDLDDQDRVAIYMFVQTGVKPLDSFRSKR